MRNKLSLLAIAAALFAGAPSLAIAQPSYNSYAYGCTAFGYYGGWGYAPPSTAPYPACNTNIDFAASAACMGPACPPPPGLLLGWLLGRP
jgi:hypothetical protein